MAWFSSSHKGSGHTFSRFWLEKSPPNTLQILSFETAKIMSRLVALYCSLSDEEFSKLRNESIKAEGVRYLNSSDDGFLLSLACEEKLEELESIAITVSRLSQKCSDSGLKQFGPMYANLKLGIFDPDMPRYNSGFAEKMIKKMEKYVSATSNLHEDLETLAEMELSERKLKTWKVNEQPIPRMTHRTNYCHFDEKVAFQRKQVKHYRGVSLWNKTFDKTVGPMAKIISIVYIRISELFGFCVPSLPRFPNVRHKHQHHIIIHLESDKKIHPELDKHFFPENYLCIQHQVSRSGPIKKCSPPVLPTRFHSQELPSPKNAVSHELEKKQKVIESAPPSTVGYAGLAIRYANIIILAQRYLNTPTNINDDTRGFMYEMLPASLKSTVRGKLASRWNREEGGSADLALAEGWRDALEEIMRWLAQVAHDTVQWQAERNLEKQRFDAKPTVLLLQTLYFSNLEKTEAAIVDVLVGLSCIYRYENRISRGGGGGGDDDDPCDFLGK